MRRFRRGQTYGERRCARCAREYTARAWNQKFCTKRCTSAARQRNETLLYANSFHRGTRRRLAPFVATGVVRCARGAHCLEAEWIDGQRVGGFIRPGEKFHLGHPDGESVGGAEHVRCNAGAPARLRARRQRRAA